MCEAMHLRRGNKMIEYMMNVGQRTAQENRNLGMYIHRSIKEDVDKMLIKAYNMLGYVG